MLPLIALLILAASPVLHAQDPPEVMRDPEKLGAMMAATVRSMEPTGLALEHRGGLGLGAEQLAQLENIASEFKQARQRVFEGGGAPGAMQEFLQLEEITPAAELKIRSLHQQQAERQADLMIAMIRAEAAVRRTLTPEQRAKLQQIEMSEMLKMAEILTGSRTAQP